MRTHGNSKLRRHQENSKYFVDASQTTAIYLAEADRTCLQQLLEHHTVLAVFAGSHANGRNRARDGRVSQHVVRRSRLLDPKRTELRQLLHEADCFVNIPDLVGIHHQLALPPNLLANQTRATQVIRQIAPHFHLEMRPSLGQPFTHQGAHLFVRVAQPSGGGRVGRVADLEHFLLAQLFSRCVTPQYFERLIRR